MKSRTTNNALFLHLHLWMLTMIAIFSGCGNLNKTDHDKKPAAAADNSWKVLFDGKSTNGWRSVSSENVPEGAWKVQNGVLIVNDGEDTETGQGGDIITTEQYGDFELAWEWQMLTKGGNGGVKYFVNEYPDGDKKSWLGLEYQILDDENFSWMQDGRMKPGDYRTLASLYEIYPAKDKSPKPLGEWNTSRIVAKGSHVEHWLNGVKVLQFERGSADFREKVSQSKFAPYPGFGEAREGRILLQDHGSKMAFRNIKIREL